VADQAEAWVSGYAYHRFVGRWSELVAAEFIRWLDPPSGLHWLDFGCGTGALSGVVLAGAQPSSLLGVDTSEPFVEEARRRIADPRASFDVMTRGVLPSGTFDVVVAGLVLNFLDDPLATIRAMRAAAPTGEVAAYVWDYGDKMQMLRIFWDAALAVDPGAANIDEAMRFALCNPNSLGELWRNAGLGEVETTAIDVPMTFSDFDELWTPFLGGQGAAGRYAMSLEPDHREALRLCMAADVPAAKDGGIHLIGRAWAVRGRCP
jgi:SAM-dependent methyltransferase